MVIMFEFNIINLERRVLNMALHFSNTETAEAVYEDIKQRVENGTINRASAYSTLNQIITDLPETWIADLAKQLRDEL